jgi:hypothetical protein
MLETTRNPRTGKIPENLEMEAFMKILLKEKEKSENQG